MPVNYFVKILTDNRTTREHNLYNCYNCMSRKFTKNYLVTNSVLSVINNGFSYLF